MNKKPQLEELLKSKIQLLEGEEIKDFLYEPMNLKIYITNYGRVFSQFGRELKQVYRGGDKQNLLYSFMET